VRPAAAAPHGTAPSARPTGLAPQLQGLPPVIHRGTRLVVLGSFPGAASLAAAQYYAHPRNQFWPLLGLLFDEPLPALPYPQRLQRLRAHGVGLWDVIGACRRSGSLDSAIRDAEPNDLALLRRRAPGLRLIVHNGGLSARALPAAHALGVPALRLPSTSPANASWSFERKLQAWRDAFRAAGVGPAAGDGR
jgi:hypoxanthine-DNA glycosylase